MAAAPTLRRTKSVNFLSDRTYVYNRVVWEGNEVEASAPARDGVVARAQGQPGVMKRPLGAGVETIGPEDTVKDADLQREPGQSEVVLDTHAASSLAPKDVNSPERAAPSEGVQRGSVQLLRIVSDLHDILLFRTQFLHRLDTMRNLRTHLEIALERLTGFTESLEIPKPKPDKMGSKKTSASRKAHQNEPSPDIAQNEPYVLMDSSIATAAEPSVSKTSGLPAEPQLSFRTLFAQLRQDLRRVHAEEDEFGAALESLSNMEYRLNEKQQTLVENLKDPDKATLIIDQIVAQHAVSLHRTESPQSASDMPSVVDRYFDRKGDIGVWSERKEDLFEAWALGKAERDFIADRGDELEVTEESFNANFEGRLEHINRELQAAQNDADYLEEMCLQAGHNIERYRIADRSETTSTSAERSIAFSSPELQTSSATVPDSQVVSTSGRRPTIRINSWLQTVSLGGTEPVEDISIRPSTPATPRRPDADASQMLLPPSPSPSQSSTPQIVATDEMPGQASHQGPSDAEDEPLTLLSTSEMLPLRQKTPSTSHLSPLSVEEHSPGDSLSVDTAGETLLTQPSPEIRSPTLASNNDQTGDCEDHG